MSLNYSIEQQDKTLIIKLNGRLLSDADTQKLTEEINGCLKESIKLLIMDLSGLEHCNSSGLGFIIKTLTRSRINQTEFVISGISGSVATLFEISKINNIISIYNNSEEALLHFTKIQ